MFKWQVFLIRKGRGESRKSELVEHRENGGLGCPLVLKPDPLTRRRVWLPAYVVLVLLHCGVGGTIIFIRGKRAHDYYRENCNHGGCSLLLFLCEGLVSSLVSQDNLASNTPILINLAYQNNSNSSFNFKFIKY